MTDREAVLETERLWLEPLRASHAAEMFDLLSDDLLYRYVPRDPPPSLSALASRFRRLETRTSSDGEESWLNWIARGKASRECVGRVEVTIRRDASAYLAYEIAVASWGKGLATEACRRVIQALLSDYGVTKIVAEVDTRNVASIRLLERLGFRRGALREHADFFKGSNSDEYTYTLARESGAGA
ncbi:MAG TPA: GNAT family protein [Candidatus Eisenbacteria bacterium]